jgi:hypothetical protein
VVGVFLVLQEERLALVAAAREGPDALAESQAPDQRTQPLSSHEDIQALRLVHFGHGQRSGSMVVVGQQLRCQGRRRRFVGGAAAVTGLVVSPR